MTSAGTGMRVKALQPATARGDASKSRLAPTLELAHMRSIIVIICWVFLLQASYELGGTLSI